MKIIMKFYFLGVKYDKWSFKDVRGCLQKKFVHFDFEADFEVAGSMGLRRFVNIWQIHRILHGWM